MGDVAVDVLWNVAKLLEAETAGEVIRAAYADEVNGGGHDYNLENLVCLGKKPAGNDPVEGDFFTPETATIVSSPAQPESAGRNI